MAKTILGVIISVIIAQMAGAIGSVFTVSSIQNWYAYLEKPFFSPPNWLFAPAWITLYTLMGIAAFLVWQKRENPQTKKALTFYFIQLALNTLWSVIFFGWHNLGLAFVEIVFLWFFILLSLISFYKIVRIAGILFIPYILWVSFAAVLNFSIWQLNM